MKLTKDEQVSIVSQVEHGLLTYKELRALAEQLKVEIPAVISKQALTSILTARLKETKEDHGREGPVGDQQGPVEPATPATEAELIMDEDLDIVTVYPKGGTNPALSRRLGGLRGGQAMQVVKDVKELAEADGYVVRRQLRRIGGVDYGVR